MCLCSRACFKLFMKRERQLAVAGRNGLVSRHFESAIWGHSMPSGWIAVAGPDMPRHCCGRCGAGPAGHRPASSSALVRNLTFGTFVAGGRNRKTRLAVMDATAVDSHRRLVLVRRDDIEHLFLIGGPTDVVVERDIRFHVQQRRAGLPAGELPEQPVRAPERARPAEIHHPAPSPRAEPSRPLEPPAPRLAPQPAHRPFERPAPQLVASRRRRPRLPPRRRNRPQSPPRSRPRRNRAGAEPQPAPACRPRQAPNGPPCRRSEPGNASGAAACRRVRTSPRRAKTSTSTLMDELEVSLETALPPSRRKAPPDVARRRDDQACWASSSATSGCIDGKRI